MPTSERPPESNSVAPADDVIELEPTTMGSSDESSPDSDWEATGTEGAQFGSGTNTELVNLLRERLQGASLFIAAAYLAFLAFSLASPGSVYGMVGWSFVLRTVVAVATAALLASRLPFSYGQLRAIEYAFFGVELLLYMQSQYSVNMQLVEQGDILSMVAFEKNGILRVTLIMLIYGVFIPNDPRVTARVVLTMAICPLIVLGLVLHKDLAQNASNHLASVQNTASNAMFILTSAALAIYAAYSLNGVRRELREARQLGQYRLLKKLGEGGMGEVYLAEHQLLKRPCALKLINSDLEDNSIALARFEREVQSAAMLSHPNTIEIYDYGHTDDGTFYYVMQYLPGLTIHDLVRNSGPMPPGRIVYLMTQVCGALAEAHRMGLVHRDLKPANILVAILGGQCDVAKVLDFGLVKQTAPADGKQLTADFTVSGTPSYMSPEQARGEREVDGRADLYSLGAILYYMATGRAPFERDNPMSVMIAHAAEPVVPPSQLRADLPADLEAVILRSLSKSPAERYQEARALGDDLAKCQCAADWDQARAERWWLELAESQSAEPGAAALART